MFKRFDYQGMFGGRLPTPTEIAHSTDGVQAGCSSVGDVMHEFKRGKLKSHGKKVRDRDQAIAIGLDKERRGKD